MQPELHDGFEIALSNVAGQLETARAALAPIEDHTAAIIQRAHVAALEKLSAVLQDCRNQIITASDIDAPVEKLKTWCALVQEVRTASDRVDALAVAVEQAAGKIIPADESRADAQQHVNNWLAKPLTDYATEPERRRWQAHLAELQAVVERRLDDYRKKKEEHGRALGDWMRARQDLADVSFRERQTRPREPQKVESFGTLSSVR